MEDKTYQLKKLTGEIISTKMIATQNTFERMRGLMFSSEMPSCDAFLIKPCNSIHTFFMLFPLDVLFLDKNMRVVKIIYNLPPWRVTGIYFKSNQVIEMKAGTLSRDILVGDKLEAVCIN